MTKQDVRAYIGLYNLSGTYSEQYDLLQTKLPLVCGRDLTDCNLFQDVVKTKAFFGQIPEGKQQLVANLNKDSLVVIPSLFSLAGGLDTAIKIALQIHNSGAQLVVLDLEFKGESTSNSEKMDLLQLLHNSFQKNKPSVVKKKINNSKLDAQFVKSVMELIAKHDSTEKVSKILRVSSDQVVQAIAQNEELPAADDTEELVTKKKKKGKK
jgi:hypothetical protein